MYERPLKDVWKEEESYELSSRAYLQSIYFGLGNESVNHKNKHSTCKHMVP